MRTILSSIFLLLNLCAGAQNIGKKIRIDPFHFNTQKDISCENGSVVCAHPLAAQIGVDIMMQGGNAVDAAIATQLALAVVYPIAGNIGGGGFMVARLANGKTIALDFRETAPGKATEDMYVNKATGKADAHLSQTGALAAGVPGAVAGIFEAMKYAHLPFQKLIQPAIELAEYGFVLTRREADNLDSAAAELRQNNTVLPALIKKSGWWKAGDTLIQKDLANTLRRIRDHGAKGFYEGETAGLIAREMERDGGIITTEDLKNYRATERDAVEFDYKNHHIITMPPPSSGGILLQQMLKMLEGYPLKKYGFQTVQSVQLITEVERRAYADRAEYLGDPDFFHVPVKTLVSDAYLQQRMADYDTARAGVSSQTKAGPIKESDQTTHFSVIDKEGNCVSITTTLNGAYGCKTVVTGAGFLLNNEMDDFSAQAGVPNMYGAIGGKANAIAPRKRMLSSMTPTIVLRDGKPFMVVGTPGGTTIITSVLQSILNVVDYGMNAHDAVNMPKFHHQWQPDEVYIEKGFPADTKKKLQEKGYKIKERGAWSQTELIKINGRKIDAAADGRGDDDAEGY